jgi:hypothetical protein
MYLFYLKKFYWTVFLDGVRGGFANAFSTVSKYEINPEEIKVNFSDVRGVSGDFSETGFFIGLLGGRSKR